MPIDATARFTFNRVKIYIAMEANTMERPSNNGSNHGTDGQAVHSPSKRK